jgi:hypothetical protein
LPSVAAVQPLEEEQPWLDQDPVVAAPHPAVPAMADADANAEPTLPLGQLLDGTDAFLRRYVVFPEEGQSRVLALWVAHTWVKHAFDYTPYLHICSPEKRCGKSRLLECLKLLCDTPRMEVSPTAGTLLRVIECECPTLLIDEVDTLFVRGSDSGKETLRGIMNAGYHVSGKVPRCVGGEHEVKDFSVFCPKVLAGIGAIPDTIADRCIPMQLARRRGDQVVTRFRQRDAQVEAEVLRRGLVDWRDQRGVMNALRDARPQISENFSDRKADIIEPLLAISDMAGTGWSSRARADLAQLLLSDDAPDESMGVKLLRDARRVFSGRPAIPTAEFMSGLVRLDTDTPWAELLGDNSAGGMGLAAAARLARMLKPFGVNPTTIRTSSSATAKGYRRDDFQDAWSRYCPAEQPELIEP